MESKEEELNWGGSYKGVGSMGGIASVQRRTGLIDYLLDGHPNANI
jgi:hypothetical protein